MKNVLFETRYFWTLFTEKDPEITRRLRSLYERSKVHYVSSITIYEIYKLTLASEGRDVAELRTNSICQQFSVVDVNSEISREAAQLGHKNRVPMADALIMATCKNLHVPCATDDPHFTEVKKVWL